MSFACLVKLFVTLEHIIAFVWFLVSYHGGHTDYTRTRDYSREGTDVSQVSLSSGGSRGGKGGASVPPFRAVDKIFDLGVL